MRSLPRTFRATAAILAVWSARPLQADDAPRAYQEDLRPLLVNRCLSCHNPNQTRGGLDLSSHAAVLAGGSGGAVVQPGDSGGSRLYQLVSHAAEPHMPPGGPRIPDAELQVFREWIDQGCRENRGSAALTVAPDPALQMRPVESFTPADGQVFPIGLPLDRIRSTRSAGAVHTLAAHPWSPLAVLAGDRQLLVYDLPTRELLGVLPLEDRRAEVVRVSHSGRLVLVGGGVAGRSGQVDLYALESGQRLTSLGEEYDSVLAADIDATQRWVALGGPGRIVRIVRISDGGLVTEIRKHTDWITALAYSPDGILLASADRNGGVQVWEAETAAAFHTLGGHPSTVGALAWRPDSDVLATGCADGRVRLWNMHDGRQLQAFSAHGGGVLSIAIARDGRILTGGHESIARLWTPDGKPLQQLPTTAALVSAVAFTSDGSQALTTGFRGQVELWQLDPVERIAVLPHHLSQPTERQAALAEEITAAAARLTALRAARQSGETNRPALAAAVATAGARHQQAEAAAAEAARDADSLAQRQGQLQADLDTARAEVDRQTAARDTARAALATWQEALAAAIAEDIRAGDALEQATRDLAACGARVRELVSAGAAADDPVLAEARCVYDEHSGHLLRLYEQVGQSAQQAAVATQALEAARQQASTLEEALATATGRTDALQTELQTLAGSISARSAGVAEATEAVRVAQEALAQRQAELAQADAEGATLAGQLREATDSLDQLRGRHAKWEAAALRPRLMALEQSLRDARAALAPLDQAVSAAAAALAENARQRANLQAELEALPAKQAELADQLATATTALEQAATEIAQLEADLSARIARRDQTDASLQHLREAAEAEPGNEHLAAARTQATALLAALSADCDAAAARLAERQTARGEQAAARQELLALGARLTRRAAEIPEALAALDAARPALVAARDEARAARESAEEPALLAEADLAECQETYDTLLARWLEQTGR